MIVYTGGVGNEYANPQDDLLRNSTPSNCR